MDRQGVPTGRFDEVVSYALQAHDVVEDLGGARLSLQRVRPRVGQSAVRAMTG
jgi:hypothetical protein